MQTNDYFKNLEKYWSANFLAFIAFFSFSSSLFVFCIADYGDIHSFIDFVEFFGFLLILGYIINFVMLGFVIFYTIFPMSLPYLLLLNSTKKKTVVIFLLTYLFCFALFVAFFYFYKYYGLQNIWTLFEYLSIYIHHYKLFFPIAIAIPALCILDRQKNYLIPNTFLTGNKIYKKFVRIFFYYFWIIYIPFLIGLLFCFNMDISLHSH